jgi:hypothetical protein
MRRAFLLSISCLLLCAFQTDWRTPSNDRGNRFEGLIRIKRSTSTTPLELVSFSSGIGEYPKARPFTLQVQFFLSQDEPAVVQAAELDEDLQYRMEAKRVKWTSGTWNTFEGWDSEVALNRVPASNLGVVVRLGGSSSDFRRFAPAFVSVQSQRASPLTYYSVALRIGDDAIRSLEWALYSVQQSHLALITHATISKSFRRGSHAAIQINASSLNEGWQRITFHGPYSARTGIAEYSFDFYHRPRN